MYVPIRQHSTYRPSTTAKETTNPPRLGGETICNTCTHQYFECGFKCGLLQPTPHLAETGDGLACDQYSEYDL